MVFSQKVGLVLVNFTSVLKMSIPPHLIDIQIKPEASVELPETKQKVIEPVDDRNRETGKQSPFNSQHIFEPSEERIQHLRRLSSFLPAPIKTPRSNRRASRGGKQSSLPYYNRSRSSAQRASKMKQSIDSRNGATIWSDNDEYENQTEMRNADCFGRVKKSKNHRHQKSLSINSGVVRKNSLSPKSEGNLNWVSSVEEQNVQNNIHEDDSRGMNHEYEATNINLRHSCCLNFCCCALAHDAYDCFLDQFTSVHYDVDRQSVSVHWFTNKFHPHIYEEAFVRTTSNHGWKKSFGLLIFVWGVGGIYTLSSASKLGFKEHHEATNYLVYFMVRFIAWLFCTFLVAFHYMFCGRKKLSHKNDDDDNSEKIAKSNTDDNGVIATKEFISYKNTVLAISFVIFGCVSMAMKAYKVRYEGVAVQQNLNSSFYVLSALYNQINDTEGSDTYQAMCNSVQEKTFTCPAVTILNVEPTMNSNMTVRDMAFNVHTNAVKEYEVIMNRIWPPLITMTCALIVKRFTPTVIVALVMALCWLCIFLTGPVTEKWWNEWQEVAFIILSQCIVLFGSKSEDRNERENFLNTFGKHLKAARVQKRLSNMRKNMDEAAAPKTALSGIIKKLNQVQHLMRSEKHKNEEYANYDEDDDELFMIDEIKSILLKNIGTLAAPTVSSQQWDNVSPEERAWLNQGGLKDTSINGGKCHLCLLFCII